jgi:hypothetical protein
MTSYYTEEFFKGFILKYIIPLIDIGNGISIKSIKVENNILGSIKVKDNIYSQLLKLVPDSQASIHDNSNAWTTSRDTICEINLSNQKPTIKTSKKHPSNLKETSKPFINKEINVIIQESYFPIPQFDVRVKYRNSKSTVFAPTHVLNDPMQPYCWVLDGYARKIYELFKEAAWRAHAAVCNNCDNYVCSKYKFSRSKHKGLDVSLLLFFIEEDDNKITWYSTLLGNFYYVKDYLSYNLVMDDGLLHLFLKPINLSNYNGKEVENLNILLSALLNKENVI